MTGSESAELLSPPAAPPEPAPPPPADTPGGSLELLKLALPLVLSQSFTTVQIFVDTVLLSWHHPDEMTASFPAVMLFWLPFALLQGTAAYVSTFVAQYTGAGRPHRVGPAVWQGLHFAAAGGLAFLLLAPFAAPLVGLIGHSDNLRPLETTYFRCLCFSALPMLVVAAANGFFSGRGKTWTVLLVDAVGVGVNIALALVLIFGRLGFPEMGMAGAGWATVAGSWAAAVLALALLFRPRHEAEFGVRTAWRPERDLFRRLLKYGGPAGFQMFLDVFVFFLFTIYVGRLGDTEMGATTLAVRLNMVAFLPMFGLGQAVCIMVGQRLGEDRPDLAERTTYTGLKWVFGYMVVIATIYVGLPHLLVRLFEGGSEPEKFAAIAAVVPTLLAYVATYSLADAANVTFSFALRGAGDTKFVTWLTFLLAWPVMVLPTIGVVTYREELRTAVPWLPDALYLAWAFAAAHIVGMAACFWVRFRAGKWKAMRVIEPAPVD